jgi:hypothetical protein
MREAGNQVRHRVQSSDYSSRNWPNHKISKMHFSQMRATRAAEVKWRSSSKKGVTTKN